MDEENRLREEVTWLSQRIARLEAEHRRSYQELERRAQEAEELAQALQLSLALQRVRNEVLRMERQADWHQVMAGFHRELRGLVEFYLCSIQFVDLANGCFISYGSSLPPESYEHRHRHELTAGLRQVVETGKSLCRRNHREIEHFGERIEPAVNSVVDVPFAGGTIAMNSTAEDAFDERDICILEQFAQVISEAYRRLRALQKQEAMRRVREEVWRMEWEEDIQNVLMAVREQLQLLGVPFDELGVNVVDDSTDPPTVRYYNYREQEERGSWGLWELGTDPGGQLIIQFWRSGKPVCRTDLEGEDPYLERERLSSFGYPVRAVVDVPFSQGTLAVNSARPHAFSAEDIALLQEMAGALSEGFRRLADLQNLERRNQELEQEIAERRQAEEALRESEQQLFQAQKMEAVGQLTAGIAHNFNNMLQAIILNLQMCLPEAPPSIAAGLRDAEEEALRAAEMIRQLMVFGRRPSESRHAPLDLRRAVQDTLDICRKTFDRKIEISAELPEELPAITGEATQVQQALLNLCVNARDALEAVERPRLLLKAGARYCGAAAVRDGAAPGWYVCLQVKDNGPGVDPQIQERIFEPFFTTKEVGRGTGLGLATVYGIARNHWGWIECHSARGQGATFSLYLPALGQGAPREEPRAAAPVPRGAETILLIDDDQRNRRVMARFLQRAGYAVLEGVDGMDGLKVFRREQGQIDLVLLDVSMPGLSGQEVLAALRAAAPQVRVVVCSGYAVTPEQFAGVGAILQKPVQAEELGRVVRRVLDAPSGPPAGG